MLKKSTKETRQTSSRLSLPRAGIKSTFIRQKINEEDFLGIGEETPKEGKGNSENRHGSNKKENGQKNGEVNFLD
jgi:hypothetical protein